MSRPALVVFDPSPLVQHLRELADAIEGQQPPIHLPEFSWSRVASGRRKVWAGLPLYVPGRPTCGQRSNNGRRYDDTTR
jgi:hypothetical protein